MYPNLARLSILVTLVGCAQEHTLPLSCSEATASPLAGSEASTHADISPDALLARLEGTHTGMLASVERDDDTGVPTGAAPVPVSIPVSVTRRVVSAGIAEDVSAEGVVKANPNATDWCPAGDHLRLTGVHLALDVVPLDGSDAFVTEITDVEVRAYGPGDDDIEVLGLTGSTFALPPSLQEAAVAGDPCWANALGRANITNIFTSPAPLFGFDIGLVADQASCSFVTFTPDA